MKQKLKLLVSSIQHCGHTDVAALSVLFVAQELLGMATQLEEDKEQLVKDKESLVAEYEALKTPELFAGNLEKQIANLHKTLKGTETEKFFDHIKTHLGNNGVELVKQYDAGSDTLKYMVRI